MIRAYVTRDLYLAAFLQGFGAAVNVERDGNGRCTFNFTGDCDFEALASAYFTDPTMTRFVGGMRYIKSRMHNS